MGNYYCNGLHFSNTNEWILSKFEKKKSKKLGMCEK